MGTQLKVKVSRQTPTPRNKILSDSLFGVLTVEIRVESERFFIGSGRVRLRIPRLPSGGVGDPESFVRSVAARMSFDVESFMRYGVANEEMPYIPGGSVKGNIRSRLELSAIPKDGVVMACFSVYNPGRSSRRHRKIYGESLRYWRDKCDHTVKPEVCRVCDIFGAPGLSSRVFFTDFPCVESCDSEVFVESVGRGVRKIEVLKRGAVFRGEIALSWLRPIELGAVLWGMGVRDLRDWGEPVLMGRLKYAKENFGLVRYRVVGYRRVAGLELDFDDLVAKANEWVRNAEEEFSLRWIDEAERKMQVLGG